MAHLRSGLVAVAVVGAALGGLAGCGSGTEATGSGATSEVSTTTAPPAGAPAGASPEVAEPLVVRIVADSEIADGVAELLDQEPDVEVASHRSVGGATMAQLDQSVEDALAADPDVLVYAGSTNDLEIGPDGVPVRPDDPVVLDDLAGRLTDWGRRTCVVVAVPAFRSQRGDGEITDQAEAIRAVEDRVAAAGAGVVSYLDVAEAQEERDEEFFAPGDLGDVHPDPSAYPAIASAIAAQVRDCR